jgi:preprotein translocase subunit SecA
MIVSQVKKLVISEITKNPTITKKELIERVNKFLEIEAIDTIVEKQDIEAEINNPQAEAEYIADIALEEFETIKQKANSQEEFYDLERRIVLSSIDELWMRHIDAMSKLREEVAFE